MQDAAPPKPPKLKPERIAQMVGSLFGPAFRPADDDESPIGPWGPVIRELFAGRIFEAEPAQGAGLAFARFGIAMLNPQPLPPRIGYVIALGQAAVIRAELIGEIADRGGRETGGGRYLLALVDDWCGTPPGKIPWPRPYPRPEWARGTLGALDHLILAEVLERAAGFGGAADLADSFRAGRKRLVEAASATLAR